MNFNPPPAVTALAAATPEGWGVNKDDGLGRCIEAAKYATLLLRGEGVECRAMACDLVTFNATGLVFFEAGAPMSTWPDEAWSVGLECDRVVAANSKLESGRRKGFGGHVVVVGEGWFLDLTAIQVARPRKLIVIPGPIVGPYTAEPGWVRCNLPLGGIAQYRFRPEFKSWRTTHAWRSDPDRDYLATMRDAMRREMARVDV